MKIEAKGLDEIVKRVRYLRKNLDQFEAFFLGRLADELVKLVGESPYIHLVKIETGGTAVYGVSIEPVPSSVEVGSNSDKLFWFMPGANPGSDEEAFNEMNPYVSSMLPVATSSSDDGPLYLMRNSTSDERGEVLRRNKSFYDKAHKSPTAARSVWAQDDIAYNAVRAEFGIGDVSSDEPPRWRSAWRKLIQQKLPDILDELLGAFADGRFKLGDLPKFEKRSREWFEENRESVITLIN